MVGPGQGRYGLRGFGDGDSEAEGLDLPDVVLDLAVDIDAGLVVAGAEVCEPGLGVTEQVPDDDQDGAGDGDLGLLLAAAAGDPVVALAEEGGGAGGAVGGLTERAAQPGVALALSRPGCGARAGGPRGTARPRTPGGRRSGTWSYPGRSCDTRSHIASELAGRRSGYAGRIAPGECSMPVPHPACAGRSCLPGCEARERAQGVVAPSRDQQARGKAGRVNVSEPLMTPRNGQLREMDARPGW